MSIASRKKFGTGYQTEAEKEGVFVLADRFVRYAKDGAGGAVQVHGYTGKWPLFGRPSERLGGPDVIAVPDEDGGGTGSGASSSSSSLFGGIGDGLSGVHYTKRPKWMCRPKTACIPCESRELFMPYCQPYGNHVVIECRRVETTKPPERRPKSDQSAKPVDVVRPIEEEAAPLPKPNRRNFKAKDLLQISDDTFVERRWQNDAGPLQARQELFVGGHVFKGHQMCGRDRKKEAVDYAEFVGVNLILALIAIYVLLHRQKFLAGRHQSMLARRIGRT